MHRQRHPFRGKDLVGVVERKQDECQKVSGLPANLCDTGVCIQVRIIRAGKVVFSRGYGYRTEEGRQAAILSAVEARDAALQAAGASYHAKGGFKPVSPSGFGRVGVSYTIKTDRRGPTVRQYPAFVVSFTDESHTPTLRAFTIGNLETAEAEDYQHAYSTAIAFRAAWEWHRANERVFKPENWKRWRQRVMYPFIAPVAPDGDFTGHGAYRACAENTFEAGRFGEALRALHNRPRKAEQHQCG